MQQLKNATVGILAEGNQNATEAKLTITNSQVYNSSNFGILGSGEFYFSRKFSD